MPARLLIVDDNHIVRRMLTSVIEVLTDVELVGVARNGQEAVELALETHPEIILMDLNMPIVNGVEATRAILDTYPDIRIIAMSALSDGELAAKAIDAGAVTCLPKNVTLSELVEVINSNSG